MQCQEGGAAEDIGEIRKDGQSLLSEEEKKFELNVLEREGKWRY